MEGSPQQADAVATGNAEVHLTTAPPGQPGNPTAGELLQFDGPSILPSHPTPDSTSPPPSDLPADAAAADNTMFLESQPMTAASSTSSSLPAMNGSNTADPASHGPSPYGTRSRNRTSNNRPNYAEDREMDGEYDWPSNKKQQPSSTATGSTRLDEVDKSGPSHRRRSVQGATGSAIAKAGGAGAAASRDHIPGMSSFSVNSDTNTPSQSQSKKRKQPGSRLTSTNISGTSSVCSSHRVSSHTVPGSVAGRESMMLTFEKSQAYLKNGKLSADDGTRLAVNDFVYMVCEPPGEPYYIARIMEFLHAGNNPSSPISDIRVNWLYRPRDLSRKATDTRLVYATMHSETCPITSLRGKCTVTWKGAIYSLDTYRKTKNCFYFNQLFDRFIRRFYDVIPTFMVTNVPERVKKVLDQRWQYVLVESGRGKELTSAIKSCRRCMCYCASNDSVDCAMCKNTYHMNCVDPPLPKKPARGFAWSCAPCTRKQEKKLEARNTPLVGEKAVDGGEEEELLDEEEEDHGLVSSAANANSRPSNTTEDKGIRPATISQSAQTQMWPFRYLGIHCKVEDVLDYDDRIYPRAMSRLGPRHQANVIGWQGRPLEYVKPAEIKRKYHKGNSHKKDVKLSKDSLAVIEAEKVAREKRPKWVIDEPPGFVHRGDDHPNTDPANTAKICFRLPEVGEASSRGEEASRSVDIDASGFERITDDYMNRAKQLAPSLGVARCSTNFLDKALQLLYDNKFNAAAAIKQLQSIDPRKDLKEPKLNKEELKRFEEGVSVHGSSLRDVTRHVGKPQKHGEIVRYYYLWKKTDRGKQIWGGFEGRKKQKYGHQIDAKLVDDVADDVDDSAFDDDKAVALKRGFECKFCFTRHSRCWRRAPAQTGPLTVHTESGPKGSKDKGLQPMVALCHRCAGLWRRYAIQWENIDEVAKKVAQAGGRAWKRKLDEELLIELLNANEASSVGMSSTAVAAAASVGIDIPPSLTIQPGQEGTRKKIKTSANTDPSLQSNNSNPIEPPRKKVVEKPPEPALIPDRPKILSLPCFVCKEMEPTGDDYFCCRHCRLTVHRDCYGIPESRTPNNWKCDMCANDTNCYFSTSYECVLCSVRYNEYDLMEPPKASHKKKTDREREKERLEKELVVEAAAQHHRDQEKNGWPSSPREALKRTSGGNWVHVTCAVWTPWIKFGKAQFLEPVEGIGSPAQGKHKQVCKLCKTDIGVCVTCHKCPNVFHVSCAQQRDYPMGFDVTPVKGSRRDVVNTITLGTESGNVEAVIYCRDHAVKSILHPVQEKSETYNYNALQVFVRNFKQADLSLTGTVRKAAIINSFIRPVPQASITNGHKTSNSNVPANGMDTPPFGHITRSSRASPTAVTVKSEEVDEDGDRIVHLNESTTFEPNAKDCSSCSSNISPKWHVKKRIAVRKPDGLSQPKTNAVPQASQQRAQETNGCLHERVSIEQGGLIVHESANIAGAAEVTNEHRGTAPNHLDDQDPREGIRTGSPASIEATIDHPDTVDSAREYLCHRCHLKRLTEPSPQLSATQPGTPLDSSPSSPAEAHITTVNGPLPAVWDTVPPANPPHVESRVSQPPSQADGVRQMSNGVGHSPTPDMANHPRLQFMDAPSIYYGNGYEHREQHHGPPHRQQHMNGPAPAYQVPRNIPGQVEQISYPAPAHSHGAPPFARPVPNGNPSPPVHYLVTQAPPGPPRATENPFLMPHQSHVSPRQHYNGMQGSPRHRGPELRPETPTDAGGRNGGWAGNEGSMTNGASASPSLRNLLH